MTRSTADPADVLELLAGRTERAAARMCGVAPDTIARWRETGEAAPHTLAKARARLAGNPPDPTRPEGNPNHVDVHCTRTSDGWIIDAYVARTTRPAGQPEHTDSKRRYPTLADAHEAAHRRFGDRLVAITPELDR
jgi:hypothetical protein